MLSVHRQQHNLSQQAYAQFLGVSQPYLSQLESGQRTLTPKLLAKLDTAFGQNPADLPLSLSAEPLDEDTFAHTLAALGYPGFAHLTSKAPRRNPAVLVLECLRLDNLDVRVAEGLPWLLAHFDNLNTTWLVAEAKLRNLQNRLGYLTTLALELSPKPHLAAMLESLEPARLASEKTLCRESMTPAERRWLRERRPPLAVHWNLLTDLQSARLERWMTADAN